MSNPNKILSHRSVLPLEIHSNSKNSLILKKQEFQRDIVYESFSKKETLSEVAVTQYLLDNPDFVQSFLLNNYSVMNLIIILNKMVSESNEFICLPKHCDVLSTNKTDPSTKSVDDREGNSTIAHKFDNNLISNEFIKLSLENSSIPELISQSSIFVDDKERNRKASIKQFVFKNAPKFSQKYLIPLENIKTETKLDIKDTTSELVQEMKNDLLKVLYCDGGNFYNIDENHGSIFIKGLKKESEQKIEPGTTLAAYAAYENKCINTHDIFMDSRFSIGMLYKNLLIKSAIAQPIILNSGEIIGVMELYRYAGKLSFSLKDEEIFNNYCAWAGLAIYYNGINAKNQKQEELNRFILSVTQKMFGKFKNIDLIIKDIMAIAKKLVKADRVSLFLLDRDSQELSARIFDNGTFDECVFETKEDVIKFHVGEGIAGYVAATGLTLNIQEAYDDDRFNRHIDSLTGYNTKSILCMPVKLKTEIIGVVQMLNKKGGVFTKLDENDFETFATYCGLALHISKMYEKILRSQQKYRVALEMLSYHNGYSVEEFDKLKSMEIPKFIPNLNSLSFFPWSVNKEYQPMYVIYMFKDLFGLELFDTETLMRFVLTIKKNYRIVPYHNWNHAFSVAHSMYALLKSCNHKFSLYESLALFIGCLCHDLDHRGKTNEFMMQSSGPLSVLYSTSTMEHHHFNMTITILQRDGHNIFSRLSPQNYKNVLDYIKHCILATDLSRHFENRQTLMNTPDYKNSDILSNRLLHMSLSMTFCDLCSMFKSWDMQLTLVLIIMQEFWTQGDEEKMKGIVPIRLMNKDYKSELFDNQVGFLTFVCLPCYRLLCSIMPEVCSVINEAENNLSKWTDLASFPEKDKVIKLQELEIYVEKMILENEWYVI